MAHKLIQGADLYKGFKLPRNQWNTGSINDILPFQMLTLEEKTIDWIKAVADFYEMVSWINVEKKAGKIQRNYMMRNGLLNQSDYIAYPDQNAYYRAINYITPQETHSPLEQFYPLIPNLVDVLRGEYIERNNTWSVEAIDPYSKAEVFNEKKRMFEEILYQQAAMEKQKTLASMGLSEQSNPDEYNAQMQQLSQQMTQVEFQIKNFRTTGVKWAEKVLKIHEKRYNLQELDPDGYECGLITDSEFWHIDLLDDDFKVELLNPKWCDYHKGPNVKYVSDGDYFVWFDFMSSGDIVNKFGRRMKEEDILKLKDIYIQTSNMMIPDYAKGMQDAYYDYTKPWRQATDLNPVMNDALLGQELVYNFMRSPNFDHNITTDIFNPALGKLKDGKPQMFRVMRLYWRSLKKIGWLTRIGRDGSVHLPDWVDENYKVTIEPQYDISIVKEKSKDNLIYGEHIDWQWVTEWRHVIKISPNQKHSFWLNSMNTLESIYIDGAPVKFQFKGIKNPFDSLPPVEGCVFSHINTIPNSFVDRARPIQIIYNILMNKIPKNILDDYGIKLGIDKRLLPTTNLSNNLGVGEDGRRTPQPTIDPLEEYEDRLRNNKVITFDVNRESLQGLGQPSVPGVLDLSNVNYTQAYFNLAREMKWEAGELVGVTRQRMSAQGKSETAYSVEQGINYSERQTEKYNENHGNLMQRVRQRMLDATQYYTTFQDAARDVYMNEAEETVTLSIIGMENLLTHYNINLVSRANVRSKLKIISQFLQGENTLEILPSAKISALVEESVPTIMSLIRQGEIEMAQKEQAKMQQEQQMHQQQIDAENQRFEEEQNRTDAREKAKNETQIEVATLRALGGKDNSVVKDFPEAQQDLDNLFRQQELSDKKQTNKDTLASKRQSDIDKMTVEREKNQVGLEKEKIKAKSAIQVAKENKNKFDKSKKKK